MSMAAAAVRSDPASCMNMNNGGAGGAGAGGDQATQSRLSLQASKLNCFQGLLKSAVKNVESRDISHFSGKSKESSTMQIVDIDGPNLVKSKNNQIVDVDASSRNDKMNEVLHIDAEDSLRKTVDIDGTYVEDKSKQIVDVDADDAEDKNMQIVDVDADDGKDKNSKNMDVDSTNSKDKNNEVDIADTDTVEQINKLVDIDAERKMNDVMDIDARSNDKNCEIVDIDDTSSGDADINTQNLVNCSKNIGDAKDNIVDHLVSKNESAKVLNGLVNGYACNNSSLESPSIATSPAKLNDGEQTMLVTKVNDDNTSENLSMKESIDLDAKMVEASLDESTTDNDVTNSVHSEHQSKVVEKCSTIDTQPEEKDPKDEESSPKQHQQSTQSSDLKDNTTDGANKDTGVLNNEEKVLSSKNEALVEDAHLVEVANSDITDTTVVNSKNKDTTGKVICNDEENDIGSKKAQPMDTEDSHKVTNPESLLVPNKSAEDDTKLLDTEDEGDEVCEVPKEKEDMLLQEDDIEDAVPLSDNKISVDDLNKPFIMAIMKVDSSQDNVQSSQDKALPNPGAGVEMLDTLSEETVKDVSLESKSELNVHQDKITELSDNDEVVIDDALSSDSNSKDKLNSRSDHAQDNVSNKSDDVEMVDVTETKTDSETMASDMFRVLDSPKGSPEKYEPESACVVVIKDKAEHDTSSKSADAVSAEDGSSSQCVVMLDDDDSELVEIMDDSLTDKSSNADKKVKQAEPRSPSSGSQVEKTNNVIKVSEELIDLELEPDDVQFETQSSVVDEDKKISKQSKEVAHDVVDVDAESDVKYVDTKSALSEEDVEMADVGEKDKDIVDSTEVDKGKSYKDKDHKVVDINVDIENATIDNNTDAKDAPENQRKRCSSADIEPASKKSRLDDQTDRNPEIEEENAADPDQRMVSISVKELKCLLKCKLNCRHKNEVVILRKKVEELSTSVLRWQTTAVNLQCKVAEVTASKATRKRNKAAANKASTSQQQQAPPTSPCTASKPAEHAEQPPAEQATAEQATAEQVTTSSSTTPSVSSTSTSSITTTSSPANSPTASTLIFHQQQQLPKQQQQQAAPKSQPLKQRAGPKSAKLQHAQSSSSQGSGAGSSTIAAAASASASASSSSSAAAATSSAAANSGGGMTIDLTEEEEAPQTGHSKSPSTSQVTSSAGTPPSSSHSRPAAPPSPDLIMTKCHLPAPGSRHPAPLPLMPMNQLNNPTMKTLPPKPGLKISRVQQGIVLSWNMTLTESHAQITNYQLFAYQEGTALPLAALWKKVGDVKALPLPMACTLTQFQIGNKYHFAVRAMDVHNRVGAFSEPCSIHLQ